MATLCSLQNPPTEPKGQLRSIKHSVLSSLFDFLSPVAEKTGGYVNVDELQARTSLPEAAALCSVSLDVKGTSREVRIDCPFHCSGDHAGRKELSINNGNPQKVFQCHSYRPAESCSRV